MRAGQSFAHYTVTGEVGQGGMGAVYRARDTRLDREVAIKVIPADMAGDPERVARFEREAKTLASLQHPNIAAVYGYEDLGGERFIVMELVEGMDLAERLRRGPLGEEEAVEIIRRVADGLGAAHRNGIVHRDLKPANIMLTSEGTVKILDFGLARATSGDPDAGGDPGLSPTITAAMTRAGTIMGTAAYMAPEQARGKAVDQRADIWAMGAILFELLAGRRLFEGETVTDVLASVIKIEPDLGALPKGTSPQVRRMLRRCLQRDPRRRLHSAADAVLELDIEESLQPEPPGRLRMLAPWLAAAAMSVALAGVWLRPVAAPTVVERRQYDLQLPAGAISRAAYRPVVSPDGRWVAATFADSVGEQRLWLRSLETGESHFVAHSEYADFPFWAPDSRFLGYFQDGQLRKLHLESGTSQVIVDLPGQSFRGGSWSLDGKLLLAPGSNSGLAVIAEDGAPLEFVTAVDTTMLDGSHRWPLFLPDGNRFIYTQWSNVLAERSNQGGIFLGSLDRKTNRRLLRDVSAAALSPTGRLLFHRNGRLMAADFDLAAGTVSGEPQLVAEKVSFQSSNGQLGASVSDRGDIYLTPHEPDTGRRLGWVARSGEVLEKFSTELPLTFGVRLAPDGRRYAALLLDDVGSVEVWIGDVARGSVARLSPFDSDCDSPVFSPDGREVLYTVQASTQAQLYRHDVSGARNPALVLEPVDFSFVPGHWFAAGQVLVQVTDPETRADGIHLLDLDDHALTPVLTSGFSQYSPRMSPDGRWLAYVAEDSGRPEIYLRNWPDLDQKWQVSRNGGMLPNWSGDGRELVFNATGQREVLAVDFDGSGPEPRLSLPRVITHVGSQVLFLVSAADHQRYLAGFSSDDLTLPPVTVLVGWGQGAP